MAELEKQISDNEYQGKAVVKGVAVAKIKVLSSDLSGPLKRYKAGDTKAETHKLQAAVAKCQDELAAIIEKAKADEEEEKANIMEAHFLMLGDPTLASAAEEKIVAGKNAPTAILEASEETAQMFAAIEDAYLRERAADIRDVGKRVARMLLGIKMEFGNDPVILCAMDIEPSTMANIPIDKVKGVILGLGSTTSHAVIIAKSRSIVTVVGLQESVLTMPDGQMAIIDGYTGQVWTNPGENLLSKYNELLIEEDNKRKRDLESAGLPSVTLDGVRVQLAANVGLPTDIDGAVKLGSEGVGLFRTEFLFMGKKEPPTEDEQYEAYKYVIEACGAHLCVIRTMDIGGDKKLDYLQVPHEENPFLGYRAIRICLERPDVFLPQLKAILRAGVHGRAAIMLPMVINIEEVRKAREFLNQAADELLKEGKEFDRNVPLGIMVETPAAAINAPNLAKEVDFFSIGTNDLCQYTLAVDRMNPKISALYDHFNPAVLRAVYNTIQASHGAGIWTGMCGEMASDPLAAALLVGMGIDELSMNGPAVPRVKEMVRAINASDAEAIVETVLNLDSGAAVRAFLAKTFSSLSL